MDAEALSDEEFARRGNAFFEERVRPNVDVEAERHKFVAIDVETGEYAVAERDVEATDQLIERCPDAEGRIWLRRVGSPEAYHFGRYTLADHLTTE
jgi:hypothetical protein